MSIKIIAGLSMPTIAPSSGKANLVVDSEGAVTSQGDATTAHGAYVRLSSLSATTVNILGQRNIGSVSMDVDSIITVTFDTPLVDEEYQVTGEWVSPDLGSGNERTLAVMYSTRTVNGFQCAFYNGSTGSRVVIPSDSTGFVTLAVTR